MKIQYSSIPKGSTQLALFKTELLPHKAMQIKPSADPEPKNLLQNTFNVSLQKQFLNANLPSSFKGTSQKSFWHFFLQKSKQRIYSVHRYWKRTTPPPPSIIFVRAAKNTPDLQKLVWWFLQQPIWYCKINPKIPQGLTRARSSHDFLEYIIFQVIPLLFPDTPCRKAVNWFILPTCLGIWLDSRTKPLGEKVLCQRSQNPSFTNLYKLQYMPCKFQLFFNNQAKDMQTFYISYFRRVFSPLGKGDCV